MPGREMTIMPGGHNRLVVHRKEKTGRKPSPNQSIGFGGNRLSVCHEKHNRGDGLFGCFLKEADVFHQTEERIKQFGGEIDHLWFRIIDHQSVEKRDLTFYVSGR